MKILAITQARTGSTRLPNKVFKLINGKSLLQIHIERIQKSKHINGLLIATTTDKADDSIETMAQQMHLPVYRGSVNDVLDRFYQAAKDIQPTWVVRLTSDCPLIDATLLDSIIEQAIREDVDYCSNTLEPSFPDGMDAEVFKFSALEKAWKEATSHSDREHVTPYIWKHSSFKKGNLFSSSNFKNVQNYAAVRLTVDEAKDFEVIQVLIKKLGLEKDWKTYADYYLANPEIQTINSNIQRNEGYKPIN